MIKKATPKSCTVGHESTSGTHSILACAGESDFEALIPLGNQQDTMASTLVWTTYVVASVIVVLYGLAACFVAFMR